MTKLKTYTQKLNMKVQKNFIQWVKQKNVVFRQLIVLNEFQEETMKI